MATQLISSWTYGLAEAAGGPAGNGLSGGPLVFWRRTIQARCPAPCPSITPMVVSVHNEYFRHPIRREQERGARIDAVRAGAFKRKLRRADV